MATTERYTLSEEQLDQIAKDICEGNCWIDQEGAVSARIKAIILRHARSEGTATDPVSSINEVTPKKFKPYMQDHEYYDAPVTAEGSSLTPPKEADIFEKAARPSSVTRDNLNYHLAGSSPAPATAAGEAESVSRSGVCNAQAAISLTPQSAIASEATCSELRARIAELEGEKG